MRVSVSRRLFFALLLALSPCIQAETVDDALSRLIETDDSLCLAHCKCAPAIRRVYLPDLPPDAVSCLHNHAPDLNGVAYIIQNLLLRYPGGLAAGAVQAVL